MAFDLPDLPYAYDALEPHIDAATMRLHHDKHHKSYCDKYNIAVEGTEWNTKDILEVLTNLDQVPEKIRDAVRNHGGGAANHALFWEVMCPTNGSNAPSGALAEAITSSFSSLEELKGSFEAAAAGQFGSGWAWLCVKDGKLIVTSTPNQDRPENQGDGVPILCLDVWEHAYYLKYQNRRADYIKAWWHIVNWDEVARRFERATG